MSTELSGKVSIITGASSGLGQTTALAFARKGAMITLCGRDQDRLKAVLDQCTQASGGHKERFITVQGDVTEASVRQNIVDKTVQAFGQLDILVANAGMSMSGLDIQGATERVFDSVFNTNVKAAFFLVQAALPSLEKSKGNVITVSSILSSCVLKDSVLYAMSKAALDHMTRCLALDLGPKGIRVNTINPPYMKTNMLRNFPQMSPDMISLLEQAEIKKQPMGQLAITDDVAAAVCFLASDAAKFITGQCLLVDGGRALTGSA